MNLNLPRLEDLDVSGKRVLCRVDFNVPLDGERRITDDTRIRAALPTLRSILERGGKPVLLSHLGRPKGQVKRELRLDPVATRLQEHLGSPVLKLDESIGAEVEAAARVAPGTCLLENVRFHPGETQGDPELARAFARLGDVFCNDAFGTSHRDHASVCGVARLLPSVAGLLLQSEMKAFERVLTNPARPFVAVLGGAKVSDKLGVIENLTARVDAILVGGGMAYTFMKAQGRPVGNSLVEGERIDEVTRSLALAEERGCRLLIPTDHVVAAAFRADAEPQVVEIIPDGTMGLDIGPATRTAYAREIAGAATVVWNGPMGVFEWEAFRAGTEEVGRAVAECGGYTVVGGGDSVAALGLLGLTERVSHVSTGGGASLELLEGRVLPGIQVLADRAG